MNLKIIKLIVINIVIVNYFNFAFCSELILPKNKPTIQKYDIELNEINYLLPKKKPILSKLEPKTEKIEKEIISLPIYPELKYKEILFICKKIKELYGN